jgi:hypothetical protein
MKVSRKIILPIVFILAAIAAFLLREVVQRWILVPAAKAAWLVRGYYKAIPQDVFWVSALVISIIMFLLVLDFKHNDKRPVKKRVRHPGPVNEMVFWIQRMKKGVYPRWHMAQHLADLALDINDWRGWKKSTRPREMDPGLRIPNKVRKYLDTALRNNFARFKEKYPHSRTRTTPLDQDIEGILDYLESALEVDQDDNN